MCSVGEGDAVPHGKGNFEVDMGQTIVTNWKFVVLVCKNV